MRQDFARDLRLAVTPDSVWNALLDFERVASWLPIVSEVREVEPQRRYAAVLKDRIGPFALRADLSVTVEPAAGDRALRVTASGEDRQVASRIAAAIDLAVAGDAGGSALAVKGHYAIVGRVATLGAPAIRKKAERVLEEFFDNLTRDLGGSRQTTTGE